MAKINDGYVKFGRNLEVQDTFEQGILIAFAISMNPEENERRSLIVLDRSDLKELINHLSMLMVKDNGTD